MKEWRPSVTISVTDRNGRPIHRQVLTDEDISSLKKRADKLHREFAARFIDSYIFRTWDNTTTTTTTSNPEVIQPPGRPSRRRNF